MLSKHKWIKILIIFFFLILSILLYSRFIETRNIVVKENKVINSDLPNSFYGFKLVQLSDIHYKTTIGREELDNIVKKVNKIKPDIIVITGDLLDKDTIYTDNDINNIIKLLNNINSKHKYIITGDNDLNDEFKNIVDKINFKLLDNTYEIIYNKDIEPILVSGLSTISDKINTSEKITEIENVINKYNVKYNILFVHEPYIIDDIDYNKFQLILSGHTHSGQINIPIIKDIFMPDKQSISYNNNYYKKDNTDLYVSSGLGTSGFKSRLFNKPTINLYRLLNK